MNHYNAFLHIAMLHSKGMKHLKSTVVNPGFVLYKLDLKIGVEKRNIPVVLYGMGLQVTECLQNCLTWT